MMNSPSTYFATAPKGIESLLAEELRQLGAGGVRETRAGVAFEGDLKIAYRACLWSRLANRILLPLASFAAPTPEDLYAGVKGIAWDEHLNVDDSLAIDFTTSQSRITHSQYGALKAKDAIVDQFRERYERRPNVDRIRPALRINIYLHKDRATVSIDLSGESLHRRGYRSEAMAAPMKENLAAAVLLRAGWPEVAKAGGPLLDPLCGSGTLLIEGALLAADSAPGIAREYFGFFGWRGHDAALWQSLKEEAAARRAAGLPNLPPVIGYDADRHAVHAANENIAQAGLTGYVHAERRELGACIPPAGVESRRGLLVTNPPYGERLGEVSELQYLYAHLGEQIKTHFAGWKAAVFTGNPDLGKRMALRAKKMYTLYNGALECKLLCFEVTPQWFVMPREPSAPETAAAPALTPGAEMFANRLRKNLKKLGTWAKRHDITCYRLYDADMPEYAVAIDLYQGAQRWVHVQEYQAPKEIEAAKAEARLQEALSAIPQVLEISSEQLFLKVRRRQKGAAQYEKLAEEKQLHEVSEGGLRFLVNFSDYLDTGLFLDHRLTRALLRDLARGRHFLNLFAYTGTATVYAAAGAAASTTTVDMSRTYLDWARKNLALNGFSDARHHYIQADCLEWVKEVGKEKMRYGLIFLDPPSFSNSARMDTSFDVQRDHAALLAATARLLAPDGVLIFSNNLRSFKMDHQALPGLHIEDITRATIPEDFARNPRIHNCWKITVIK
jgi:23S rRNA (guanine2445-N2)-methyltransferase / 23S rRNA (guanine2069-N7)-methyltransferase